MTRLPPDRSDPATRIGRVLATIGLAASTGAAAPHRDDAAAHDWKESRSPRQEHGQRLPASDRGSHDTALAPRTRADTNAGLGTVDDVRLASRHEQVFRRRRLGLPLCSGPGRVSMATAVISRLSTFDIAAGLLLRYGLSRRRCRDHRSHRLRRALDGPRRACAVPSSGSREKIKP
jgi:hypothetical protein